MEETYNAAVARIDVKDLAANEYISIRMATRRGNLSAEERSVLDSWITSNQ